MKGLEATEIRLSAVLADNKSHRIDSQYFGKTELLIEDVLRRRPWKPLSELTERIASFGAYDLTNQIEYVDEGIPFLRCLNIKNGDVDFTDALHVTPDAHALLAKSEVKPGMVLLTMSGSVGSAAVAQQDWTYPVNSNQDIAKITPARGLSPHVLASFLNGVYGQAQMRRLPVGSIQQHVFLWQLDNVAVPIFSESFQRRVGALVASASKLKQQARNLYHDAEVRLLEALGLKDWKPEEPLTYVAKASEVIKTDRIDAEYFRPGAITIIKRILDGGGIRLGEIAGITSGHPWLSEQFYDPHFSGDPVVRIRDCKPGLLDVESLSKLDPVYAQSERANMAVSGDILVGMDGLKWFYAAQVACPCYVNQRVCHIHIHDLHRYPSEFVALVINSPLGQMQLLREMTIAQTVGHITNDNVRNLWVPVLEQKEVDAIVGSVRRSFTTDAESKLLLEKAKRAVELAIEEGEEAAGRYLDGKAYVQETALPDLMQSHAYFSTEALRDYLEKQKLTYSPQTVNTYISRMKGEGAIYGAGRGWYSSVVESYETDRTAVNDLVASLESRFPLLDFACWSSGQLNPYLEHTLGKPVAFVYVERDAMSSVYEALKETGSNAYLNPTRLEAKKLFSVGDQTVVVRPSIDKAPLEGHFARVEKLLVDLHVERELLNLVDADEFREAAQRLVSTRRIELAKLIMYAGQRKVDWRDIFSEPGAIIAEGDAR